MSSELEPFDLDNPLHDTLVTRRSLVQVAGVSLVATALYGTTGCAMAPGMTFPPAPVGPARAQSVSGTVVGAHNGGTKPVFVARAGSQDPVEHSVADTLFWGDIMMEHAMFFAMLMPGDELASQRGQAEQFQRSFEGHLGRLRNVSLDRSDFVQMNRTTIELVRPFAQFKRDMQQAQESGQLKSLVWPLFFEHTRHEAERFMARLGRLSGGDASFDRAEVVPFWAQIMDEHSQFIAHLLDPQEDLLIEAAEATSDTFRGIRTRGGSTASVMAAAQAIIDFKTAAGQGIQTGQIKSIIHPALADHVRREAVRFKDELTRAS
ncbi:MAG: DUF2935 domain-containing protein [Sphingosinicella sp.]